jgi:hypothetical protein
MTTIRLFPAGTYTVRIMIHNYVLAFLLTVSLRFAQAKKSLLVCTDDGGMADQRSSQRNEILLESACISANAHAGQHSDGEKNTTYLEAVPCAQASITLQPSANFRSVKCFARKERPLAAIP